MANATGPTSRSPLPHERLQAWSACHQLARAVYLVTFGWPREDPHGLTELTQTAARKAPMSVAIGADAGDRREFRRCLDEAIGALSRLGDLLLIAKGASYLRQDQYAILEIHRDHAARLTAGLRRSLDRRRVPRA